MVNKISPVLYKLQCKNDEYNNASIISCLLKYAIVINVLCDLSALSLCPYAYAVFLVIGQSEIWLRLCSSAQKVSILALRS